MRPNFVLRRKLIIILQLVHASGLSKSIFGGFCCWFFLSSSSPPPRLLCKSQLKNLTLKLIRQSRRHWKNYVMMTSSEVE